MWINTGCIILLVVGVGCDVSYPIRDVHQRLREVAALESLISEVQQPLHEHQPHLLEDIVLQYLQPQQDHPLAKLQDLPPFQNLSGPCRDALIYLTDAITYGQQAWPLNIIDSTGKPGVGLMEGNLLWTGSYSECTSVTQLPNGTSFNLANINLIISSNNMSEPMIVTILEGICSPAQCFEDLRDLIAKELLRIENNLIEKNVTNINITLHNFRSVVDPDLWTDVSGVSRLCALIFFVMLVVMATVMDIVERNLAFQDEVDEVEWSARKKLKKVDGEDERSNDSASISTLNFDHLQLKVEDDITVNNHNFTKDLSDISEEDVEVEVHTESKNDKIVIPEIVIEDWEEKREGVETVDAGSVEVNMNDTEASDEDNIERVETVDAGSIEVNMNETEASDEDISEEHSGVIGKIDALINDLEEEIEKSTERARNLSVSADGVDDTPAVELDTSEESSATSVTVERGWNTRPHGLSEEIVYSMYENNIKIGDVIRNQEEREKCSSEKSWSHPDDAVSLREMILAFSALQNTSKLTRLDAAPEDLDFIHGIRFLSLTWVILGHTVVFSLPVTDNPKWALDLASEDISFQVILQGTFAVDSFFFISGLLMSFLSLQRSHRKPSLQGMLKMVVHRFVRLTPAYLAIVIIIQPLSFFACSGPFCPAVPPANCPNYWWRNLLNIQNFFPYTEMCAGWTWYLALDFQFFLIAIIIHFIFSRVPPTGLVILPGLLLGTWITTFIMVGDNSLSANILDTVFDQDLTFDVYYDKPWTRAGPYLIGLVAGYIIHRCSNASKSGESVKLSLLTQIVCWLLAAAVSLSLIFGLYKRTLSEDVSAVYLSLARSAWAVSLAWISVCCYTNYGGPVNTILSLSFFRPLARLTYAAYLIHPVIMQLYFNNLEVPFHASIPGFMVTNLGLMSLSYSAAFAFALVFESPWLTLQKLIGL